MQSLSNPIVAAFVCISVFLVMLFLFAFVWNKTKNRFASPWSFGGLEPTDDQLIFALQTMVPRMRRKVFRPPLDSSPFQDPSPPTGERQLEEAESKLGFELPPLLRRTYREVGNGGFGPAYGLIGVGPGATDSLGQDLVDGYRIRCQTDSDDRWFWPRNLLPIISVGGGTFLCADLSSAKTPILVFEPNTYTRDGPVEAYLQPCVPSLKQLLVNWLEGKETPCDA
jgi:hypothetical protein